MVILIKKIEILYYFFKWLLVHSLQTLALLIKKEIIILIINMLLNLQITKEK